MDVEKLNYTENIKWGVGVVFNTYPNEDTMVSTMSDIRKALREKSAGDIYWHIVKNSEGWCLSGNIAATSNGITVGEPEPNKAASGNSPL